MFTAIVDPLSLRGHFSLPCPSATAMITISSDISTIFLLSCKAGFALQLCYDTQSDGCRSIKACARNRKDIPAIAARKIHMRGLEVKSYL